MAGVAQPNHHEELLRLRARVTALEKQQRELSDFFENASVPIDHVGPDGTILWANRAELDFLGYTQEEYVGRNISEFHLDSVPALLDRLARNDAFRDCPALLRARDGTPRRVLISSTPVARDGAFVHARIITRDVAGADGGQVRDSELRMALHAAHMGTWEWEAGSNSVTWSPALEEMHFKADGSLGGRLQSVVEDIWPQDRPAFDKCLQRALEGSHEFKTEYRVLDPEGGFHWIQARGSVQRDLTGKPVRMVGVCLEITERKRHEILLSEQKRVLELAARGTPLGEVLSALAAVIDEHCGAGLLGSILLLDRSGAHLTHGGASSLPPEYVAAIDGIAIGPDVGSCGTAAFLKQTVIVSDIAADPLWTNYRDVALANGLRACWSTPILSSRGQVLGTFAVYSRVPRRPAPEDLETAELLSRTAGIVLERRRSEQDLARSVEQMQALYEVSTAAAHAVTPDDIAGTALSGLMRCISPDRAAVLLFDDAGVMRFAASRGLSEHYRAQVEGHSPWARGAHDAAPVLVPDPGSEPALAAHLDAVSREGIRSLAFVPVMGNSGVQGKFMIYYDAPHEFTPEEVRLAETIAAQIGFTLERKRAEQALRESEDRFRSLGACSPAGIFLTDMEGRCTYTNPRCQEICGFSFEQSLGAGWEPFVHPADRELVIRKWRETAHGSRRFSEEFRFRAPSGEVRWVHIRTSPMVSRAGMPLGHVGTVEDITARKGAERRLTMQYEVTRVLSESATPVQAAPRLLEVIGNALDFQTGAWWTLDKDSSLLRCLALWQSPSAGAADLVTDNRTRTFQRGIGLPGRVWADKQAVWIRDVTTLQIPRIASDAGSGLRSAIAFPILLEGNEAAGVLEFFAQTVHEPDFLLLHTLEAIGSQTGQFIERRHLEQELLQTQKVESIGLLAGGVAHDFNNLLVGVMGNASLAADYLEEDHPARRLVDDVVRTSERAAALTRQLLAYAGRGQFVITRFDVSDLVNDTSSLLRTLIPRNVSFRLELGAGLPPMEADPSQIQQLVMNLVINAVEAIGEDRRGSISLRTALYDVDAGYARAHFAGQNLVAGRYVGIEVTDSGCGMQPETRQKIFDPFFSTKALGRGLGLAAAAGIVRSYKGAVSVESEPGQGATFLILLPAAVGELAPGTGEIVQHSNTGGAGTVLVVDDEEVVRSIAKSALERAGYRVELALDGEEALAALRSHPERVSAVVLDLSMPVMSGEATAKAIRNSYPDVPILLSSGYNESDARRRLGEELVDGFIQKPYKASDLARAVAGVARGGPAASRPEAAA